MQRDVNIQKMRPFDKMTQDQVIKSAQENLYMLIKKYLGQYVSKKSGKPSFRFKEDDSIVNIQICEIAK